MFFTTVRWGISIALILQLTLIQFSKAQTIPTLDPAELNISDYSDAQIMDALKRYNLDGIPPADLAVRAKEAGFTEDQIEELIMRSEESNSINTSAPRKKPTVKIKPETKLRSSGGIFGSEFFTNSNVTFEPDMKIATPGYYILGPGDKLLLSIFGNSEASYKLEVSTEGYITIPYLGPILVTGQSIDNARKVIKKKLLTVYPSMATGQTSFQLALGDIRSIRVTMIGEINKPAVYTLPSLATIANALHESGGPTNLGSLREIDLIRNGKKIVAFDFYDFLVNGDLSKNLMLQDGDIIKVNTYINRIFLAGAVKRPAYFDMEGSETLRDAIMFAGGFSDNASRDRITVYRVGQDERQILNISEKDIAGFQFKNADSIVFNTILDRFDNRVNIAGSVFYPGDYSILNTPSLSKLISSSRLKENSLLSRGVIRRKMDDYRESFISFNVSDVLSGKDDVILIREDHVTIYSKDETTEKFSITINGEVNSPGVFPFGENLQLPDLILLAGGFKEGASGKQIEIGRRVRSNEKTADSVMYAIVKVLDIPKNYQDDDLFESEKLQPYDIISVRKLPEYREQATVRVSGEVNYPGEFVIRDPQERLSDVIKRAGGLNSHAFSKGAVLLRKRKSNASQVLTKEDKLAQLSGNVDSAKFAASIDGAEMVSVGINLDQALSSPRSVYDIFLESGDELHVPPPIQTIQAFGAVNNSVKVVYQKGMSLKDAIVQSGGFNSDAKKAAVYVINANGVSYGTKKVLFFRRYPEISNGSEIYVPLKKVNKLKISDTVAVGASVTSGVLTLVYLLSLLRN